MTADIYVSLSGHIAKQERLTTIAGNVANLATPGFRAEEVHFEAILSRLGAENTAFSDEGGTFISRRSGAVMPTGNPLDVAIEGPGWFGLQTGGNAVAYTRDGRFTMTEDGRLVTVTGHEVLDAGGAPIALAPRGGTVSIREDGTIVQGGNVAGVVGVFMLPENAELSRFGDTAVLSDVEGVPAEDPLSNRVKQGFVEGANVDPVRELSRLIMIQREFESVANSLQMRDRSLRNAISQLGPSS